MDKDTAKGISNRVWQMEEDVKRERDLITRRYPSASSEVMAKLNSILASVRSLKSELIEISK